MLHCFTGNFLQQLLSLAVLNLSSFSQMMEQSQMLVVVGILTVLCGSLPVDSEFLHAGEVINRENIKTALGQLTSDLPLPSIIIHLCHDLQL